MVRPRVLVSLFEGSNPSALEMNKKKSLDGEMVNTVDSKSIALWFRGSSPLQGNPIYLPGVGIEPIT